MWLLAAEMYDACELIDHGKAHATMHGAGKFGLASLCNRDLLPPTGAVIIAAPLKIVNGSGSRLRVIAIAPA